MPKNVLGHQAYILESIKALGNLKSYRMHLTWDDGETDGEFIFGMVTNTTSVGGFRGLAPKDVSFHDGLFEGVFIRTPKTPADLPNIISGLLLFPEQKQTTYNIRKIKVYGHRQGRDPVGPRR